MQVLPTTEHLAWADCELGVIIHYAAGLSGMEHREDVPPAQAVNLPGIRPERLDTDQWLAAASAMGARYAVFVTNQRNCQGVSLWPSASNPLSLRAAPFRDGGCDMVAEFMTSCKRYGIRPGLYYQVGCGGHTYRRQAYRTPGTPEHDEYLRVVEGDLTELWTRYGDLFEIWFDGGIPTREQGGPDIAGLLERYQPRAVCFQGPADHSPGLRWIGNEDGQSPLDCWSTAGRGGGSFNGTAPDEQVGRGDPDGSLWLPAETDMPNRDPRACGCGWGWRAGEEQYVHSPSHLLECYYTSVGRNSNLLLGQCIDDSGLFPDAWQFEALGKLVADLYARPLATARGEGDCFTLSFGGPRTVRNICLMEELTGGERVREFTLTAHTPQGERELLHAGCIGHKRLLRTEELTAESVTLRIHKSTGKPQLRAFTAYA